MPAEVPAARARVSERPSVWKTAYRKVAQWLLRAGPLAATAACSPVSFRGFHRSVAAMVPPLVRCSSAGASV
jgi:hypothetical protein